jgi:hypothetical protein
VRPFKSFEEVFNSEGSYVDTVGIITEIGPIVEGKNMRFITI